MQDAGDAWFGRNRCCGMNKLRKECLMQIKISSCSEDHYVCIKPGLGLGCFSLFQSCCIVLCCVSLHFLMTNLTSTEKKPCLLQAHLFPPCFTNKSQREERPQKCSLDLCPPHKVETEHLHVVKCANWGGLAWWLQKQTSSHQSARTELRRAGSKCRLLQDLPGTPKM